MMMGWMRSKGFLKKLEERIFFFFGAVSAFQNDVYVSFILCYDPYAFDHAKSLYINQLI